MRRPPAASRVVAPPLVAPPATDGFRPSATDAAELPLDPLELCDSALGRSAQTRFDRLNRHRVAAHEILRFLTLLLRGHETRDRVRSALSNERLASSKRPSSCSCSPRLYARNAASDRVGRCSIAFRSAVVGTTFRLSIEQLQHEVLLEREELIERLLIGGARAHQRRRLHVRHDRRRVQAIAGKLGDAAADDAAGLQHFADANSGAGLHAARSAAD